MWTIKVFNTDIYHLIASFVVYSVLGWFVESVYMSFCNRKITNRGFAKSPFCPIYGFGAVAGYIILGPMKGQYIKVYLAGAFLATVFEYIVGKSMIALFGQLWWDYNNKPFNFQGILCLESTIAWGFYALGIVHILHTQVYRIIDLVNMDTGILVIKIIFLILTFDYIIQLIHAFKVDVKAKRDQFIEYWQSRIIR